MPSLLAQIEADWKDPTIRLDAVAEKYGLSKYRLQQYSKTWKWGGKARLRSGPNPSKETGQNYHCAAGRCEHWDYCTKAPPDEPVRCEIFMYNFEKPEIDNEPVYIMAIPMNTPIRLGV